MAGSVLKSVLRSPRYAGQDRRLLVALASLNDEHGHRALQIDPQQAQRLRSKSPVSRNRAHDDQILSLSSSVLDADGDDHCGVGLQVLRKFNGDIMVMSVRTDGPAKRSGIHAGAIISAIGQTPVQGLEVEDVMDLLYGPAGSIVRVRTTEGESGASEPFIHVLIRQRAPLQTELDLQRLVTASQKIIQASEQPWHIRNPPLYQHLPPRRDSQGSRDVQSITRGLTSPFGGGGGDWSGGGCSVAGAGCMVAGDGSGAGQRGGGESGRDFLGNTQLFTTMRSLLDTSWSKKSPPQVTRRADAPERQPHTLRESLYPQPRRAPHASSSRRSRPRLLEPDPQGGGVASLSGTVFHNGCPGAGTHVCGIGVQLVKCRNGDIVVLAVHQGSAAEKARIKKGDIIIAVDEKNVSAQGLNCIQVAGLVSGPEGTLVRLFLRDKEGRDNDILVPRQTAPSVSQEILAGAAEAAAEFWNSSTGMGTGTGTGIGGAGAGAGAGAEVGVEVDKNAALPLTMYLELEEQAKNAVRDTKS
jgi:membrane-associated protease RseP (regulator of RpoE activity)